MSKEIVVTAKIVAKQETVEQVKSACMQVIEPTRAEAGCMSYVLHQGLENPAVFIFVEKWSDEAALEQHLNTEHLKGLLKAVDGQVEEVTIDKSSVIA